MNTTTLVETGPTTAPPGEITSQPRPRPFLRRTMQFIRRTHLYLGLFLFPWAVLYGMTGFLFNHPEVFADNAVIGFDRTDLAGTAAESLPSPQEQANAILAALNEQLRPSTPFQFGTGHARYANRENFFANVKADQRTFFVAFDPESLSGTIRETTRRGGPPEPAPFAVKKTEPPRDTTARIAPTGLKLDDPIPLRVKSALLSVFERKGIVATEVSVTSAPDIKFPIIANGKPWTATYNLTASTVSGTEGINHSDLTFRQFLLRMHLSHRYPGEMNLKWFWALGVDAIAATLIFWGFSGLLMWWQIKSTRMVGLIVVAISAAVATTLAWAMHGHLAG